MVLTEIQATTQREPIFVPIVEKKLWTFDDMLAEFGETTQPMELWDGEITMAPAPTPRHQRVGFHLAKQLSAFVEEHALGEIMVAPVDVIMGDYRALQPDILFIANENRSIIQDRIRGVPDLVVEVVSTSSWERDNVLKRAIYETFGVREYWLIDPDADMIQLLSLEKGEYRLVGRFAPGETVASVLLAGFECSVSDILQKG
jgi:Uma2 family endonuclease